MDPSPGTAMALLERIAALAPADDAKLRNCLAALKQEIKAAELTAAEREKALAAYEEAYEKLTSPANRVGVFLRLLDDGLALVALGDSEYVAKIDPQLDLARLSPGCRIRLNEAYAVVGIMDPAGAGPVVKVSEVLSGHRLRVGTDLQNLSGKIVELAGHLRDAPIKAGDEVALDATGRVAVECFERASARDCFVEDVPFTPWDAVGGQEEAIRLIRETIEHPLLYPEIYKAYDKKPIKGVLLYGPPGCGKTLIGKAVASNLSREYSDRFGREAKECFMHINGPKILNMWLGETERMVREIFEAARERAREGRLVVLFIDEAESVLRTRSSGRWLNISNTVVPQFCAEMDGMVELENVVLILTSNRPDYIDPAILRPERIDRKIKIKRPDQDASRAILSIYLHGRLPVDGALVEAHIEPECARRALIEATLAYLWREDEETEFMRVSLRNGTTQTLHWRDFVSGALLKSVVDRAKDSAIRREIAAGQKTGGLNIDDLREAVRAEFGENEIFPKTDAVEDWLKLLDLEPEQVVTVTPVRHRPSDRYARRSVV